MKISNEALTVLGGSAYRENSLVLPPGNLDRRLYVEVNKVLEALGGKWNKKAKAHLFDRDAEEALDEVILTGEFRREKQDFGVFYTPECVADLAALRLRIDRAGIRILEPSAGRGALVEAAEKVAAARGFSPEIDCIDILEHHAALLREWGYEARQGDFLEQVPEPIYDRVIMNPPFAKAADARHVLRAIEWLRPGGRLVAIMSAAITFRDHRLYNELRSLLSRITLLPEDAFKESGTGVRTVLVAYDKPKGY